MNIISGEQIAKQMRKKDQIGEILKLMTNKMEINERKWERGKEE